MKQRNILILALIVILIWLPTGPSDIFIIPFIIDKIGFEGYVLVSIVLVLLLYRWIEGKTLKDKMNTIRQEVHNFIG